LCDIWEELEQYKPMIQCNCPILFHVYQLEDRIIQFLIGLNGDYQSVASQFLFMEPMPLINKVFSMVKQQERKMQYEISPSVNDESGILVSTIDGSKLYGRGKGDGSQGRDNSRVYTYNGKVGNTTETCYKKNGHPPHLGRENG
jgi:hypothetical protein